jgi:hypothetical protein
VFNRQFEAISEHENWAVGKEAIHLSAVLQGKVADILHSVHAGEIYGNIVHAIKDYQVTAAYCSQLKARTKLSGESLQTFSSPIEQLSTGHLSS